MKKLKKPEWAPENSGDEFSTHVLPPVSGRVKTVRPKSTIKKSLLSLYDYLNGIIADDRTILARAITVIESNSPKHISLAQELLKLLLPYSGKSIRVSITGAPGSGKSTFIEAFGNMLCELRKKVAVLAIDPSSSRSRGSILGDKTRMEMLSRQKNAFIRPSPSGGTLGGVAKKTRESIIACEAAGFDIILIETIGVGQSEISARSMVDFYMLVLLPGEGDELQGFKKGSVELADCIVINKADGNHINLANITKEAYSQAVHYLQPATEGWETKVLMSSALNSTGLNEIWRTIRDFESNTKASGIFEKRRQEQTLDWLNALLNEKLLELFRSNPKIQRQKQELEKRILEGKSTPVLAAEKLIEIFLKTTD